MTRWLGKHESFLDWMTAWFGGSATAYFWSHSPLYGWTNAAIAVVLGTGGVIGHATVRRNRATS